ncbi:hypothetical protein [Flavobacterium orientale]|uniref:Uncharacterized protein n=1 Tax=Flavobacterium orientale TaxID=1756020 RepID=A0A916Y1Y9_9FLAO|nr:hypothetical protein [Flavobacterium orientale]GGD26875.1 hypothetical protein GCM10011343_16380 [Flavobacterium orientale]
MKPIKLGFTALLLLFVATAFSQVNITIGTPPPWGPAGYTDVRYYYVPDIEMYYDVQQSQYVYFEKGKWYRKRNLPGKFKKYDFYSGYKVVVTDYHGPTPYLHFNNHKVKYPKGYKGPPQKTIGSKNSNKNKSVFVKNKKTKSNSVGVKNAKGNKKKNKN